MPVVHEIVVNGIICKTSGQAIAITGGKTWELRNYLRMGRTTYNGFHVEHLRHDPPIAPEPSPYPALDRFLRGYRPIKKRPRYDRYPILSRRHVTSHLGIYR